MEVIYGGGNRSSVVSKVQIGELDALVVSFILSIRDLQFCSILLVELFLMP